MITTLTKLKERLNITDALQDGLLTQILGGVGARFEHETGRRLTRTADYQQEFAAERADVPLECYPVETVSTFELKTTEAGGWVAQSDVDYLLPSSGAVLSLLGPLGARGERVRVTYTGGYVMPGEVPGEGQTALPAVLETAAIEQAAMWYQLKNSVGIYRVEAQVGTYLEVADRYWVPWVRRVLGRFRRLAF